MNMQRITHWAVYGAIVLAGLYMIFEPAVTFAGEGGMHGGG